MNQTLQEEKSFDNAVEDTAQNQILHHTLVGKLADKAIEITALLLFGKSDQSSSSR